MRSIVIRASICWLTILVFSSILAACATTAPECTYHSFQFNAQRDSPEIEILDYLYGDAKGLGVRPPDWMRKTGTANQKEGIYARRFIGDTLYVKWRIRSTGEVFQDTVDLRHRLPADMKNKTIYFIVKGVQLHAYLQSEEKLPPSSCKQKREKAELTDSADDVMAGYSCYLKYIKLYPDQEKH